MKILFIHTDNIIKCPPAINVIECLLDLNNELTIITYNAELLPKKILDASKTINLGDRKTPKNRILKYIERYKHRKILRRRVNKIYNNYDYVWTTSEICVREVGKTLLDCRHIMQFMELADYVPMFGNQKIFTLDIKKYAQHAYKIVVPEYNRAHILKARWQLTETPIILPNKPYNTKIPTQLSDKAKEIIDKVKKEERKILLYQGGFTRDRRFEEFAKAAEELGDDYCLYLMGFKDPNDKGDYCAEILEKYPNVVYLGALNPPEHLAVAQYAYIGLLPYIPTKVAFLSELNVLYCAPNKIYEYALCDLPMIGTDMPSLNLIFEKYEIGVCCKELTTKSIIESINELNKIYSKAKNNCKRFYNDTDLTKIIKGIISSNNHLDK